MKPDSTKANIPNKDVWQRAKDYTRILASRARDYAHEVTTQPVKKFTQADPRVKNLFIGAALAAPGFVGAVAGATTFVSNQDVIDACRNRPVSFSNPVDICKAVESDRNNSLELIMGGSIEMIAVAGGTLVRDGHLVNREAKNKTQSRQVSRSIQR